MTPNGAPAILVVDDDQQFLQTVVDILSLKGIDAVTALTGGEGVRVARDLEAPPQVALIDLRLPDMDGLELLERLKELSDLTEVVVLTGHASFDTAVGALRSKTFDYLVKPVPPDDLLRTLDRARERWHNSTLEDAIRRERERQGVVLIVEDDDRIRHVLRRSLSRLGWTVLDASHGREALSVAEGFGDRLIDVVFTDYNMPGLAPEEFVPILAARYPAMGLVLASGSTVPEDGLVMLDTRLLPGHSDVLLMSTVEGSDHAHDLLEIKNAALSVAALSRVLCRRPARRSARAEERFN